jgi:hypothetical protein
MRKDGKAKVGALVVLLQLLFLSQWWWWWLLFLSGQSGGVEVLRDGAVANGWGASS